MCWVAPWEWPPSFLSNKSRQGVRPCFVSLILYKNKHSLSFSFCYISTNGLCPPPAFQHTRRVITQSLESLVKSCHKASCKHQTKPSAVGRGLLSIYTSVLFIFCYRSNSIAPEFTTGGKKSVLILLPCNQETDSPQIYPRGSQKGPGEVSPGRRSQVGEVGVLPRQHEKEDVVQPDHKRGKESGITEWLGKHPSLHSHSQEQEAWRSIHNTLSNSSSYVLNQWLLLMIPFSQQNHPRHCHLAKSLSGLLDSPHPSESISH